MSDYVCDRCERAKPVVHEAGCHLCAKCDAALRKAEEIAKFDAREREIRARANQARK